MTVPLTSQVADSQDRQRKWQPRRAAPEALGPGRPAERDWSWSDGVLLPAGGHVAANCLRYYRRWVNLSSVYPHHRLRAL